MNSVIFKIEFFEFKFESILNGLNLLGNDWKDFEINSIKLIKTDPISTLANATKKPAHSSSISKTLHIIQRIRTIENKTLNLDAFAELLDGLCFAGARRAVRVAAHAQFQGHCHRQETAVGQSSDHETGRVTDVLVRQRKSRYCLLD